MNPSDAQNISMLIKLCKEQGVQRLKMGDIEIELAPKEISGPDVEKMRDLANALEGGTMSNEEALFASAPQYVSQEEAAKLLAKFTGQG